MDMIMKGTMKHFREHSSDNFSNWNHTSLHDSFHKEYDRRHDKNAKEIRNRNHHMIDMIISVMFVMVSFMITSLIDVISS